MIGFFNTLSGRMVGSVSADSILDEIVIRNTPPGSTAHVISTEEDHFLLNGSPVLVPPQLSEAHSFNTAAGEWQIDASNCNVLAINKRNRLLAASDWTQLPDVPLATKEVWATYRQALRDITDQPGYPLEVVWPVAPG